MIISSSVVDWINKLWYIQTIGYYRNQKGQTTDIFNNVNKSEKYFNKLKKTQKPTYSLIAFV